jgi:PleD family two-component response regulator
VSANYHQGALICPRAKGSSMRRGHWRAGTTMSVILIVEDEEQVRVLAESFLQTEGNKTLSAATIEQALALIEGEEPVDLLFRGSENSG